MANLVVRNLDRSIVEALKKQAVRHGRGAEAEHRAILESALTHTRRKTLAQALATMPNVGSDEDFARKQDKSAPDVLTGYQCRQRDSQRIASQRRGA